MGLPGPRPACLCCIQHQRPLLGQGQAAPRLIRRRNRDLPNRRRPALLYGRACQQLRARYWLQPRSEASLGHRWHPAIRCKHHSDDPGIGDAVQVRRTVLRRRRWPKSGTCCRQCRTVVGSLRALSAHPRFHHPEQRKRRLRDLLRRYLGRRNRWLPANPNICHVAGHVSVRRRTAVYHHRADRRPRNGNRVRD